MREIPLPDMIHKFIKASPWYSEKFKGYHGSVKHKILRSFVPYMDALDQISEDINDDIWDTMYVY